MNRLEKLFLILTCVGGIATGILTLIEKWRTVPVQSAVLPLCAGWKAPAGDVCVHWHNATVLWQWEGKGQEAQWPTVVCDKWENR